MAWCAALTACSSSSGIDEDTPLDEPHATVSMLPTQEPIQLTNEQRMFANNNNLFTLQFLNKANQTDRSGKSFVYSPLSITYVLGMVNDAAEGTTREQLENVLGFTSGGIEAVNNYCKKLIEGLPKVDNTVQLDIANAIFVNKEYTLMPQFQQHMHDYYAAEAESYDFASPATLGIINDWCNEKSHGMIPTILDDINPNMMSYLLNAIYFKANWASKFDEKYTRNETFTTPDGETQLPMMHQKVLILYAQNDIYSAVQIPYGNGYWTMTILLPHEEKTIGDVVSSLLAEKNSSTTQSIPAFAMPRTYEVDLKLPRFETKSDTDALPGKLDGVLKQMGITEAFDPDFANIPNMCDRSVYINMIRQKAAIKVNEEGSEAAAVTVVGMMTTSMSAPVVPPKATFHANRPFVYTISESSSGVLLFVGRFTGKE